MKRLKRFTAFFLIFIMLFGVLAYAADSEGNGTSTSVQTTTGQYGATKDRTGFLLYVVDKAGNLQSKVVFVPYKQIQTSVKGYPVDPSGLVTRYGDSVDMACPIPAPWNMGAWEVGSNYRLSGTGQKIKEFLLRGNNIQRTLELYLLFSTQDKLDFINKIFLKKIDQPYE